MYRTGIGFDVHALAEDKLLIIGGVQIPHQKGLLGHSDADVLVHAVMDAVLGSLALGDIGQHFPDTDAEFKGANSLELLSHVNRLAEEKGFVCTNLDSIIMAEKPKMAPYLMKMRANLATALKIKTEQVSIKATTTERLGLIGREEGIAAQAIVLLNSITNRGEICHKLSWLWIRAPPVPVPFCLMKTEKLLPKQMLHWPVIIPNPAGLSRFRKKYGAASDKLSRRL